MRQLIYGFWKKMTKKEVKNKHSAGFTLIEAVVASAVFAFAVSSSIGVYLSTMQIDAKTRAERAVQQNGRFIMEFLGKEIRNGKIDYNLFGGAVAFPSTTLHLINQLNESETITCSGTDLVLSKTSPITGSSNLNTDSVDITRCGLYIWPSTDPFLPITTVPAPPNIQPHVMIVLQLRYNYGNKPTDNAVMDLQTTFTVRDYPTRE